jgi:hypothetical protein
VKHLGQSSVGTSLTSGSNFGRRQQLSSKKGQAMLELFDSWLAQRDLSAVEQKDWPASARVGVGIYYYEQLSAAAGVEK